MRFRPWLVPYVAVLATLSSAETRLGQTPEALAKLKSMSWLEGRWRGPGSGGGTWEAYYTAADGGVILSVAKHLVAGELKRFEFERFWVEGNSIVLTPSPQGQPSPASFLLTELDSAARRAVFENPEHDFPQILTYHRVSDTRLVIGVHAMKEGRHVGFEIDLTKQ